MHLVGRRAEDHAPPLRPPLGELRPEPGDQALSHAGRLVLVVHREVTRRPAVTDGAHGRADEIDDEGVRSGPAAQGGLDDGPRPRLVSCDEAGLETTDQGGRNGGAAGSLAAPRGTGAGRRRPRSRGSSNHTAPPRVAGSRPVRTERYAVM